MANKGDTPQDFVNSQLQLVTSCSSYPWAAETEWMNILEKIDFGLVRVSAPSLLVSTTRSESYGYSQQLSFVQSYYGPTFESNRIPCAKKMRPLTDWQTMGGCIAVA